MDYFSCIFLTSLFSVFLRVNANFLADEYLSLFHDSTFEERQWEIARKLVKNSGPQLNCEEQLEVTKKSICDICWPAIQEFWRHFSYRFADAHCLPQNATFMSGILTFPHTNHPSMLIDVLRCDFLTTRGGNWNPYTVYITRGRIEAWTYFLFRVSETEYVMDHLHVRWLIGLMII